LYFPTGGTAAPAIASRPSTSVRGHGEHILFVDDEPALASLGKKVLEHGGYRVTACTSPLEALAAFRSNPDGYDLVITDLTMPNLAGTALAAELLKLRGDIPIILTTGFGRLMTEDQAFALGIRGLLRKPVAAATDRRRASGAHSGIRPGADARGLNALIGPALRALPHELRGRLWTNGRPRLIPASAQRIPGIRHTAP
jgi:CheY-like chemotaxis protein